MDNNIIKIIKEKKELRGLNNRIVEETLKRCLKKKNIDENEIETLGYKNVKSIIKEVRAELRQYAGRFQENSGLRKELIEKDDVKELLKTHTSSKERIEDYSRINQVIRKLNVKSVLDLGCGINPIGIANKDLKYHAGDINQADLEIVKLFFEKKKIDGRVFYCDLRKIEEYVLPEVDLCLLMKVFDVVEKKGHKLAEKIMKNIKCENILVSFSTKTLSGKPMNHPQRGWIERLIIRLGWKFETFKTKNEIFYLIKKE